MSDLRGEGTGVAVTDQHLPGREQIRTTFEQYYASRYKEIEGLKQWKDPDRLLQVAAYRTDENTDCVERIYYQPQPLYHEVLHPHDDVSFAMKDSITFYRDGERYRPTYIERTNPQGRIRTKLFLEPGQDPNRGLSTDIEKGSTHLTIQRTSSGDIKGFHFFDIKSNREISIPANLPEQSRKHEPLLGEFICTRGEKTNITLLERYDENGKLLDRITVPFHQDSEIIVKKLLDSFPLHDPYNAPYESDSSWITADLDQVLGIEWK